jgi:hypothetical protein
LVHLLAARDLCHHVRARPPEHPHPAITLQAHCAAETGIQRNEAGKVKGQLAMEASSKSEVVAYDARGAQHGQALGDCSSIQAGRCRKLDYVEPWLPTEVVPKFLGCQVGVLIDLLDEDAPFAREAAILLRTEQEVQRGSLDAQLPG